MLQVSQYMALQNADDHQVYRAFHVNFQYSCLQVEVNRCLSIIKDWMDMSFLKLNGEKTEIIVFSFSLMSQSLIMDRIIIDSSCIVFSDYVKNLGFWLDSKLTFDIHVSKLVSQGYHLLKNIARIKSFLTTQQLAILCNATLMSRVDYCNCLFFGMSKTNISKLQRLQNATARLIYGRKKRDSVSDLLIQLHWLPIECRIYFKIILLMFKCLHSAAPVYLSNSERMLVHMPHFSSI